MSQEPFEPYKSPSLYGEEPEPTPAAPPPSLMDQFVGVFTEPGALFQKLRQSPAWLAASALLIVISLLISIAWLKGVDLDAMMRPALEASGSIPADKIDDVIAFQSKIVPVTTILGALLGIPIVLAFSSLIHWLVSMGNKATGILFGVLALLAAMFGFLTHVLARLPQSQSPSALVPLLCMAGVLLVGSILSFVGR